MEERLILDRPAIERSLTRLSFEIIERNKGCDELCIIGIMGGGILLSKMVADKLSTMENRPIPWGVLDTRPYRDDCKQTGQDNSSIPFEITGKRVVLIDDVLYTGRTVRAAIDGLMKKGRPSSIQLGVLVDRGHRELPIRADFVGKNLPTSAEERVSVTISEELCEVTIIK